MALTKVGETTLFAIASTASNAVTVGSDIDVSTYYEAFARVRMGRGTATAFTVAPEIRIEGAFAASPTANQWVTLWSTSVALGATVASTAVSGTEAIGQTVVSLTSGTNFVAGDYIFFHNTTIGNSEWKYIVSTATNDITIQEGLVFAQTGATARDQAEQYGVALNLVGINRLRGVINGAGSGQAVIVEMIIGPTTGL